LALDHAHQRGLVHRDIKPENILADGADLTTPPTIKLLDMGLARLMHEEPAEDAELTGGGKLMGTPDYVSPEQAMQAGDADIRSDIYSLGATFYKILTGEVPFEGGDVRQRLMTRLVSDAPRASGCRDDLPEEVDEIIARMLARQPDDRFQTPAELAEALFPFTFEGQRTAAGVANAAVADEGDEGDELGSFFDRMAEEDDDVPDQPVQAVQPVREAVSGPPSRRAMRGRRQAPRRNWVVGVVVGCAISVPVVALMFWGMRPATLVLNWPLDQRRGSQLLIDGDALSVPRRNPASVSVPAGKRRVVIRRRGYDPIEWTLDLTRGQQIKKRVTFQKTDLSRPFRFGTAGK
ncbi:MAG TPA: serine/threonine-protein kinase, partial [Pirellulales bacterium]|nr:serine/threonine-protein kinase [Pirellulales bacterium]